MLKKLVRKNNTITFALTKQEMTAFFNQSFLKIKFRCSSPLTERASFSLCQYLFQTSFLE